MNTKVFFGNFSLFTDSIPPEEAKKAKIQKYFFGAKIGRKWREKVPLKKTVIYVAFIFGKNTDLRGS